MKILSIPQKTSGTGNIHDLASDQYDRDIKFPKNSKFAVIKSSYYGGKGYTTHKTFNAALNASNSNRDYSCQILDVDGNRYNENGGKIWGDCK